MGLPGSAAGDSLRSVGSQDRRRRLRRPERCARWASHCLRWGFGLEWIRPPWRPQQDHRRVLVQRAGEMRSPRRLELTYRSMIFSVSLVLFAFLIDLKTENFELELFDLI